MIIIQYFFKMKKIVNNLSTTLLYSQKLTFLWVKQKLHTGNESVVQVKDTIKNYSCSADSRFLHEDIDLPCSHILSSLSSSGFQVLSLVLHRKTRVYRDIGVRLLEPIHYGGMTCSALMQGEGPQLNVPNSIAFPGVISHCQKWRWDLGGQQEK